jgi:hypothetical protein
MSNNKQSSVEKEFVPHAEALALKQLGFDQPCFAYWNADHSLSKPFLTFVKPFDDEWFIPNPLYSQAFRWFRENYSLQGIIWSGKISTVFYGYNILNISKQKYIINNTELGGGDCDYETYEEAELACLRRLIEIVQGCNK